MSDSQSAAGISERVVLAEIHKPRGIRGELTARSLSDVRGRFKELKSACARLADGSDLQVAIENAWEHKGDWVFKFSGVDSANDAERFSGAELWVPRSERASLPDGEYFESDLVGCRVVESGSGTSIGTVTGFQHYGGPALMEVTTEPLKRQEILVPFVPGICRKVDLQTGTIEVDLPDGLLEL